VQHSHVMAAKIVVDDADADLWEQLELLQEQLENVKLTNSCLSGQLAERLEVERQRAAAVAAQIMPAAISVQNSSSRRSAEDEFGEIHSFKRNRYRGEDSGTAYVDDDGDVDEPMYRGPIGAAGQRAAQGEGEHRTDVTVLPATDDADDADLEFHETSVDSELSEGGVTYRSCSVCPDEVDEEELAAAAVAGLDVVAPQKVSVDQLREINAALQALAEKGPNASTATADVEAQLERLRLLLSAS